MKSISVSRLPRPFLAVLTIAAALSLLPAAFAQAQQSLSADDVAEIHNLYAHYNLVLDAGDSQAWADTFTDLGSFNDFVGRQALVGFADNWAASNPDTRHWNSNIHLTATADGAAGTAYLMLWKVRVQPAAVVLTGTYTDELVKTAKGWRFKARRVAVDRPGN